MKLSEALNRYYVLPLNQFEIVDYSADTDLENREVIVIVWNDSDNFDSHRQEFLDQDIEIGGPVDGQFLVTTVQGETVAFIALTGVNLEHAG